MASVTLEQFKETVDKEIKEYEAMDELYKIKQAVLVQGKSDALWDVDAKIVERMNKLKKIARQRKDVARYLGDENLTMSEAIDKAKAANNNIVEKLQSQKTKLNLLSKVISLHEQTNMELIKHGLIMAEKSIQIIFGVVMPAPNQYDKQGKNVGNEKLQISSVVEDA